MSDKQYQQADFPQEEVEDVLHVLGATRGERRSLIVLDESIDQRTRNS